MQMQHNYCKTSSVVLVEFMLSSLIVPWLHREIEGIEDRAILISCTVFCGVVVMPFWLFEVDLEDRGILISCTVLRRIRHAFLAF